MPREPISYIAKDIFTVGLGEVVVCRFKNDGRVEAGTFLVDVFCLGVKAAMYDVFRSEEEFREELLDHLSEMETQPGPWGRKLVEEAVAYAAKLGFSPHSDYKKGARVFGGIHAADCEEEFVFGRNGQPFYMQGPDDPPAKIERVHAVLRAHVGENGYGFEIPPFDLEEDPDFEGEDRLIVAVDSQTTGKEPSPLLVSFAEEYRYEHPEFAEIIYASAEESLAAAEMVEAAKHILNDAIEDEIPDMTLDSAMKYLQTLWNLQMLTEEQRTRTYDTMPQPKGAALKEALEGFPFPKNENPAFILDFLILQADEPGNERILLLMEPA